MIISHMSKVRKLVDDVNCNQRKGIRDILLFPEDVSEFYSSVCDEGACQTTSHQAVSPSVSQPA